MSKKLIEFYGPENERGDMSGEFIKAINAIYNILTPEQRDKVMTEMYGVECVEVKDYSNGEKSFSPVKIMEVSQVDGGYVSCPLEEQGYCKFIPANPKCCFDSAGVMDIKHPCPLCETDVIIKLAEDMKAVST